MKPFIETDILEIMSEDLQRALKKPRAVENSGKFGKSWKRKNHWCSPVGNARKCHFCIHRVEKGELTRCTTTVLVMPPISAISMTRRRLSTKSPQRPTPSVTRCHWGRCRRCSTSFDVSFFIWYKMHILSDNSGPTRRAEELRQQAGEGGWNQRHGSYYCERDRQLEKRIYGIKMSS
jgi:hypothetical protein